MVKLNEIVYCEPNGNLKQPFVGRVEKIYERTVLVKVLGQHDCDRWKVIELTGRVIVAIKKVKAAVLTTPEEQLTSGFSQLNEA
ncbi:hypothetical protein [uncultured Secundilactobacillus sp.]|uniref:hypothetical protein n=1 Tax=uncultured Secundilactobacillus sp. TaxID=2813935 RepID=UPI00258C3395|nr:hypothetical protein [uncultured Secundilactobacillus sp.]